MFFSSVLIFSFVNKLRRMIIMYVFFFILVGILFYFFFIIWRVGIYGSELLMVFLSIGKLNLVVCR